MSRQPTPLSLSTFSSCFRLEVKSQLCAKSIQANSCVRTLVSSCLAIWQILVRSHTTKHNISQLHFTENARDRFFSGTPTSRLHAGMAGNRVHFLTFYDAHGVLFLFLGLFFYVINISKYILMRAIDHYSGGEEWLGHLVRLMMRHNRSKKANIIIWA